MPTVHVDRLDADLHLGKHPATPLVSGTLAYAKDVRPELVKAGVVFPKVPASFGHGTIFSNGPQPNGWGMAGNGPQDDGTVPADAAGASGAGDCALANPGHQLRQAAKEVGPAVPGVSCLTALKNYAAFTATAAPPGYDLQTGANDNGSNMQAVNLWLQDHGFTDDTGTVHKWGPTVALEPGNLTELWEGILLFGDVDLGVIVTQAQVEQFNAHQPWDYVKGSPTEGGHAIPAVGKGHGGRVKGDWAASVSWGEWIALTGNFLKKQVDEAHAKINPIRVRAATGRSPEGYTPDQLIQFLASIAKQKQLI